MSSRAVAPALAAVVLAGQVLLALLTERAPVAAALGVVVAAGVALIPALPPAVRRSPVAVAGLVLPLGAVALDLGLVSLGVLGVPLTAATVLLLTGGLVAGGTVLSWRSAPAGPAAVPGWLLGTVAIAVLARAGLALTAVGDSPPSGSDWGKYLLFAEEAARTGELQAVNPFWMLGGLPFSEDPGAPVVYAALLAVSGGPALSLTWGIVVVLAAGTAALAAAVHVLFGARPAALAALAYGVSPGLANMAGWHGLANAWALMLAPLAVLGAGALLRGERDLRWHLLTALGLTGMAVGHPFTFVIVGGGLAVLLVAGAPRAVPRLAMVAVPVVLLPAVDRVQRLVGSGGVQPSDRYLDTKVVWDIALRDLTWPLAVAGILAFAVAVGRARHDRAVLLGPAVAVAALVYAYGWVAGLPGYYIRAVYFLPLAIALTLGAALAVLRPDRRILGAAAATVLAAAIVAPGLARDVRSFYGWTDPAVLRGLDLVADRLRPGEAVATDRCLGFPATWLLQRPTMTALRPSDIGPANEVAVAARARAVLRGAADPRARFLLVNPSCPGSRADPSPSATPVFASDFLVVYELASRNAAEAAVSRPDSSKSPRGPVRVR